MSTSVYGSKPLCWICPMQAFVADVVSKAVADVVLPKIKEGTRRA